MALITAWADGLEPGVLAISALVFNLWRDAAEAMRMKMFKDYTENLNRSAREQASEPPTEESLQSRTRRRSGRPARNSFKALITPWVDSLAPVLLAVAPLSFDAWRVEAEIILRRLVSEYAEPLARSAKVPVSRSISTESDRSKSG